jgi:hypothetical protein
MGPIKGGFTGTYKKKQETDNVASPQNTTSADLSVQAELNKWLPKLQDHLGKHYDNQAQSTNAMTQLISKWKYYEKVGRDMTTIGLKELGSRDDNELRTLLHNRDFEGMGDFILREDKEALEEADTTPVPSASSLTETDGSSSFDGQAYADDESESNESSNEEDGGVTLMGTAFSPLVKAALNSIAEEAEDDASSA